ncbi:hypothetical protein Tco_0372626, partial [Tanacetum coccineum]
MHCETTNDDEKEKKSNKDKVNAPEDSCKVCSEFEKSNADSVLSLSQEDLEAIIIRVNGDDDLEPQQKSMITQNLMMSRWINTQKKSDPDVDEPGVP